MKRRDVIFTPEASDDLERLYDRVAAAAGTLVADRYVERLRSWCKGFEFGGTRGQRRDDIRPGLRVVGFERRVAVAFYVDDTTVVILRVFYGGRNWEPELLDS